MDVQEVPFADKLYNPAMLGYTAAA
jgi:hypothetical protein